MTEDDEAKQRAHEVAANQPSLSPNGYEKALGQLSNNNKQQAGVGVPQAGELSQTTRDSQQPADGGQERACEPAAAAAAATAALAANAATAAASETGELDRRENDQQRADKAEPTQRQPASRHHRRHHHHHHQHNNHHNSQNNNNNNNHSQNHNNLSAGHRKHQHQHLSAMGYDGPSGPGGPLMSADYLAQLIKDKKQLGALPANLLLHVPRLVEDEIQRVRQQLFQLSDVVSAHQQPLELPEPEGELVTLQEKIYVPVDRHPEYNFVGRLLGPRGMTAKQLEMETGCKIMIRGKGSMRDKKKEEQNRGKANWEHLNDDLHVLITVEDTLARAQVKLGRAIEEVRQLLVPVVDGEDELKKRQLMELAIINGTYRDCNYNDALSKMLDDAAHRHSQVGEHGAGGASAALSSGGSPPTGGQLRHSQAGHAPHYSSGAAHLEGSSGFPSAGSTPNSLKQGGPQQAGANRHHHGQPGTHLGPPPLPPPAAAAAPGAHQHNPASPHHFSHPTTVAMVAAAAAAAAAHQQVATGPPQSTANPHHAHPHHAHAHPHPHSHPHLHHNAHAHSQQAAAAAAAAAALMSASPAAEANAILYVQQYHDFQHYAAMAAAAAASQQASILPPPQPPPDYPQHPYAHHHPHPHPHHQHQHQHQHHQHQAAVAQAVAAAAAANEQYHRQLAEQQQHSAAAAAGAASAQEMVNYHQEEQQQQQHAEGEDPNGNNPNEFQGQALSDEVSVSDLSGEPASEQQQQQVSNHEIVSAGDYQAA